MLPSTLALRRAASLALWTLAFASPPTLAEDRIDTAALGDRGFAFLGPVDASPVIHTVESVGDVDGDGLGDIAVSFLELPHEESQVPYAFFLIYGRPRLSGDVPLAPELERTWQVRALEPASDPQAPQVFDIDAAGDLDADGYGDFLLGYGSYPHNGPGGGVALLVYGGPHLEGRTTLEELLSGSDRVTVFRSSEPRYQVVGWKCRLAGDFNGDGAADIAITAPQSRLAGVLDLALGAVFIVFGSRDLPRDIDVAQIGSSVPGVRIEGFEETDAGGRVRGSRLQVVVPLGDFDGDELDDIGISASGLRPRASFVVPGDRDPPAVIRLAEAASKPGLIEIRGPHQSVANTSFGGDGRLAGLGDVNGDGLADLALS